MKHLLIFASICSKALILSTHFVPECRSEAVSQRWLPEKKESQSTSSMNDRLAFFLYNIYLRIYELSLGWSLVRFLASLVNFSYLDLSRFTNSSIGFQVFTDTLTAHFAIYIYVLCFVDWSNNRVLRTHTWNLPLLLLPLYIIFLKPKEWYDPAIIDTSLF